MADGDDEERVEPARSRRRIVRVAMIAASVLVVAGGVVILTRQDRHTGAPAATTVADAPIEAVARAYADALLRGSVADVNATYSSLCSFRMTEADLAQLRASAERAIGRSLADVRITSIETRQVTATDGQALVHFDLPAAVSGNDNWLSYGVEEGRWRLRDCTMLPFGGNSSSSPQVSG